MQKYFHIIAIVFLLNGCGHISCKETCSYNITLTKVNKSTVSQKGYDEKIERFQYLLGKSIEVMLDDINRQSFCCSKSKNFSLEISYQNDDIYSGIKRHKSVRKHTLFSEIKYTLKTFNGKEVLRGKIRSIDSFITPSYFYADVLSSEDSQLTTIENISKQLQHEITTYLQNL
jgi:hypothetical protein